MNRADALSLVNEYTKNPSLVAMVKLLQRDLEIVRDMANRDPFDHHWTITIHRATLEAIRGGDPRCIDQVMDEHLSFLERVWEEQTGLPLRSASRVQTASEPSTRRA